MDRLRDVRMDFWRSPSRGPCSKQLQQEHVAQGCVHLSFEYLQIYRFYHLGRPLQGVCLSYLHLPSCYMVLDSSKMLPRLSEGWTSLNPVLSASPRASWALSCGSSVELSAGITLVYQCLSYTGDPKVALVVWSVTLTAHSVSCAPDRSCHFFSPGYHSCHLLCIRYHNHAVSSCDSHGTA